MPVNVLSHLPSGVLLGNKFIVDGLGMRMDLRPDWGSFNKHNTSGALRKYSCSIYHSDVPIHSEDGLLSLKKT